MSSEASDVEAIETSIKSRALTLQIIHLALVVGVSGFFIYQLWQGPQQPVTESSPPLIPLAAGLGGILLSFVLPVVIRPSLLSKAREQKSISTDSLFDVFQQSHIPGIALLEGAGFFVCFSLGGVFGSVPKWMIALPVAIIAIMLLRFPWRQQIAEWIASQQEELAA